MMNFSDWLDIAETRQLHLPFMRTPVISRVEARSRKMFGPVYHGTTEERRQQIGDAGFKVFVGPARAGDVSHGYQISDYNKGIPAPVHHLGYGIYFTTVKRIAQQYNGGTATGLVEYYLDVPKLATINYGSPNTMMKWWQENGYDMPTVGDFSSPQIEEQRVQATVNLTNNLKSKYDAVWFKGKGIKTLLDGDQVVVFDVNRIYRYDPEADRQQSGIAIGDRIKIKDVPLIAKVSDVEPIQEPVVYPEWQIAEHIFGHSNVALRLANVTDPTLFEQHYTPIISEAIPKVPKTAEFLQMRIQNTGDSGDVARIKYAGFLARKLLSNLPSALAEQVYKKGTRIPKQLS